MQRAEAAGCNGGNNVVCTMLTSPHVIRRETVGTDADDKERFAGACDSWAVAVVLYFLLYGRWPFSRQLMQTWVAGRPWLDDTSVDYHGAPTPRPALLHHLRLCIVPCVCISVAAGTVLERVLTVRGGASRRFTVAMGTLTPPMHAGIDGGPAPAPDAVPILRSVFSCGGCPAAEFSQRCPSVSAILKDAWVAKDLPVGAHSMTDTFWEQTVKRRSKKEFVTLQRSIAEVLCVEPSQLSLLAPAPEAWQSQHAYPCAPPASGPTPYHAPYATGYPPAMEQRVRISSCGRPVA